MRKVLLLLLLAPSALVYACGGDDTNTADGGPDATGDVANDTSKADTGTNDTGTQETSTQDATPDVALSLACFKPADCIDGGDPDAAYPPDSGVVCCGNVVGNGGTQTTCQIEGASTTCKAPSACTTDFSGLTTCSSATVRFCTTNAECTEKTANPANNADTCCTASAGDAGSFHVCANTTIAAISGGKITCP